ncbi:MAG: helix-turn-helix domain-containing protein [Ruminococcaceae bacterium]|nr:helix-turn-helix domain-containing protein [Oscillospiraceae bacterium]
MSDTINLMLYSNTSYFSRNEQYSKLNMSVNMYERRNDHKFSLHWHDFYELELIVDGTVTHTVNNHEYHLKRGDIHFITQADFHKITITSPTVTIFNLVFLPKALSSNVMDSILSLGFCHTSLTEKQFNEIYSELQFLLEQYNNIAIAPNTLLLNNSLERVLILFLNTVFPDGYPKATEKRIRPLQNALIYMRENYSRPITLSDVSKAANLETTYFCRYFSSHMNMSFTDYLNKLRCSIASCFLSASDRPIEQIAFDVGYTSASYFSKTFRRFYGISPVAYRRNNGNL